MAENHRAYTAVYRVWLRQVNLVAFAPRMAGGQSQQLSQLLAAKLENTETDTAVDTSHTDTQSIA